jgi:xylan 1,4-beta-xylosidase
MQRAHRPASPIPNPVIPGFHPDPSVCRVGEAYALACSSFEYFPGVPVFVSDDLRTWRQVGNALDRPEQLRLAAAGCSGGVYAPTLRHHDGRLWLVTTNVSDQGHIIVTATDPAGPWSDPVVVDGLAGIDPDLAWDDTGACWFTYADGGIMQAPIDPATGTVLDRPRHLWSGTGLAYPEAPHLYQIDGAWYLLIAEGGTERGHAVSVARAAAPTGPFEPAPANPVLTHAGTRSPVQNTGHGDLVQAADGTWWMVLLGVRPRGGSPGYHGLGRETFLTPVHWVDGWPIPEPVSLPDGPPGPVRDHDDFDADRLAPQWISLRGRDPDTCALAARAGWLTLAARDPSLDDARPTFVGRRQQHTTCVVRTRVDAATGRGGLCVRIDDRHHYAVEVDRGEIRCRVRIGPLAQEYAHRAVAPGPVVLRLEFGEGPTSLATIGAPPDQIRLAVETADGIDVLSELDGRYLTTEVAGGFTGRVVGMYATDGTVAFDWYEYTG